MKILYQNVVSIFLFLTAGLSVVTGQQEESLSSLLDKIQVLSDDDRIIFPDENGDNYLQLEINAVEEEERLFQEEESAYERELAVFLNNKSRHEDDVTEFQKKKPGLIKKLEEYKESERRNDERFKSQLDELEAEENSLKKLKVELEEEEIKLAELENQEKVAQKELSDRNEILSKRKEELNKKRKEFENQKKVEGCTDAEGAEELEKRLQESHGKCIDIPEGFREHVKEYQAGNSKLCYTVLDENDYDHEEMDIDIRMS